MTAIVERRAPDQLLAELWKAGAGLEALRDATCQVVLFGSRAAGVSTPLSDWDLLCIGRPSVSGREAPMIQRVWLDERALGSRQWLESELAGHVARYGVWLHGEPDWAMSVKCGAAATERKARRIASRIRAAGQAWSLLSPGHRTEWATLLRRDLQRHAVLARGEAVPPTRFLDDEWQSLGDRRTELGRLLRCAGVTGREDAPCSGQESEGRVDGWWRNALLSDRVGGPLARSLRTDLSVESRSAPRRTSLR